MVKFAKNQRYSFGYRLIL